MSAEDQAQALELLEWARNNTRREVMKYEPTDPRYGPPDCQECEEPMPALRREAGRTLCTACQSSQERHKRRYGH